MANTKSTLRSLLVVVAAGGIVFGAYLVLKDANRGWQTYANDEFGYEIGYPSGWTLTVRDPQPGDDFEYQEVRLSKGETSVLAAVNFQGGWCETGRSENRDITVSGVAGVETYCYYGSEPKPAGIVRYFKGAKGELNYTVFAQPTGGDVDTVRKIVQSFRFTD